MTSESPPACSWDSAPHPVYNMLTTGNVSEVLPGVTRPLPADLINLWDYRFVTAWTRQLGVADLVATVPPPAMNLLGFVGGRWTLNVAWSMAMTATYQTTGGSEMLAQFVEGDDLSSGMAADVVRAAATRELIVQRWRNAEQEVQNGRLQSQDARERSRRRDHTLLSNQQLLDLVDETASLCADLFVSHATVSVGGAEFTTMLEELVRNSIGAHPSHWVPSLTSALADVESLEPAKAIWDLSRIILRRPRLAAQVREFNHDAIALRLVEPPDAGWRALADSYRDFVDRYGFRGQREVDPSTRTWDEASEFVISAIRASVAAPSSSSPYVQERRATAARQRIQGRIDQRLSARPQLRDQYHEYLGMAQLLDRLRESTKANWARACRGFRPPIMELGRRFASENVIGVADDVWYLRLPELQLAAQGQLPAAVAREAVATRAAEYRRLGEWLPPEGIFELPARLVPVETIRDDGQLVCEGMGISPGRARGRARVILSADAGEGAAIEPGEILVARVTDAPMTPLFIPAAGVVVEVGGRLSHAAIVARECGVPAVAGIKGATQFIRTGMMVTVDGNAGRVIVEQ